MNSYYDDDCSCHERESDGRCFGCGSRDTACSIGGEPYCGSCYKDEKADQAERKRKREKIAAEKHAAELNKLLSAPLKEDPRQFSS